jgi:hypothetical protein
MQRLNTIQGVRNKKSIALPRCISRPFSMTIIPESLALRVSQNYNTWNECETQNRPHRALYFLGTYPRARQ